MTKTKIKNTNVIAYEFTEEEGRAMSYALSNLQDFNAFCEKNFPGIEVISYGPLMGYDFLYKFERLFNAHTKTVFDAFTLKQAVRLKHFRQHRNNSVVDDPTLFLVAFAAFKKVADDNAAAEARRKQLIYDTYMDNLKKHSECQQN